MSDYLAYQTDPLTLEFEARIVQQAPAPNGQADVWLESTYFYPTGGGQPHDTGTLGGCPVTDVFKDQAGQVVHRIAGELPDDPVVAAKIDAPRRLGHMQHHSAQHMVSWALDRELGLPTLSAKISADSPSTVDVPNTDLTPADLVRVEDAVNALIFENLAIKTYTVPEADIESIPLRRPPKVSGQIRIVEVDGLDYSACGGTHCPQTGMIGLIKLLHTETVSRKTRLHFVAGGQALAYFRQYQQVVAQASAHFGVAPADVFDTLTRQSAQLAAAEKAIGQLQGKLLTVEGADLLAQARQVGATKLVIAAFDDRPVSELRRLLKRLQYPDTVALLASFDGKKATLLVSCGKKTGVDANSLLQNHLSLIDGRGGGNAQLAQGGGKTNANQFEVLFAVTETWVKNAVSPQ